MFLADHLFIYLKCVLTVFLHFYIYIYMKGKLFKCFKIYIYIYTIHFFFLHFSRILVNNIFTVCKYILMYFFCIFWNLFKLLLFFLLLHKISVNKSFHITWWWKHCPPNGSKSPKLPHDWCVIYLFSVTWGKCGKNTSTYLSLKASVVLHYLICSQSTGACRDFLKACTGQCYSIIDLPLEDIRRILHH